MAGRIAFSAVVNATLAELRARGVDVLGDAIDLVAINRRLGFFKDNNENIIELAGPLKSDSGALTHRAILRACRDVARAT